MRNCCFGQWWHLTDLKREQECHLTMAFTVQIPKCGQIRTESRLFLVPFVVIWHSCPPVAKSAHYISCTWIPSVFGVCDVSFSRLSNQFQPLVFLYFGSSYQHYHPPSPYPSSSSTDSISVTSACFPHPLCRDSWLGCPDLPAMGAVSILDLAANSGCFWMSSITWPLHWGLSCW